MYLIYNYIIYNYIYVYIYKITTNNVFDYAKTKTENDSDFRDVLFLCMWENDDTNAYTRIHRYCT